MSRFKAGPNKRYETSLKMLINAKRIEIRLPLKIRKK